MPGGPTACREGVSQDSFHLDVITNQIRGEGGREGCWGKGGWGGRHDLSSEYSSAGGNVPEVTP